MAKMLLVFGVILAAAASSTPPAGFAAWNATTASAVRRTDTDASPLMLTAAKTYREGREMTLSVVRPFPFLQVVRFANNECETESGFSGTCYTESECRDLRGLVSGECADGYGVCCFMTYSCRETMHHNVSYFVPPTYPHREDRANVCPLKIAFESDICQIRLDFIKFDILGPREGDCIDDMFVVMGGNANHRLPVLCGENTNQHVYINVDTVQGPVELQMITGIESYLRDWRIKISMISCVSQHRAPVGCLQYQTGISGHVRSFNFNQRNETRLGYLNGVDYAICFRRERDMCSITYSVRTEQDDLELLPDSNDTTPYGAPEATMKASREQSTKMPAFGIATSEGKAMDFQAAANVGASKCTGDYIAIPSLDRFCGGAFNQASGSRESQSVTVKNAGPLMILFKTDKAFNGRGFNINFQQGPCTPLLAQAFF
ncbi:hypothetical protein BIW11_01270 [Tropilaelaps mercedesae]|uniref:CUB domain-containing protein n=1 Tax=Tropilaelaps mercedesae TaxID=418985 RepID=A0A1V9XGJ0_9ACAR|nr:hypothetical protein BIW11_01270 [Tropilaelaps mercedesae]